MWTDLKALFPRNVCVNVNVNINFNTMYMVTQTPTLDLRTIGTM